MYKEGFASKLKKARANTGFTQREVSKETNITASVLARYETGKLEPNLEVLGILADFYGVSVDWLLGTAGGKSTNFDLDGINREKNHNDYENRKII